MQTRLMASVRMTHAERDGVEGTLVKVSVAAESEVFLPTRDPEELARRRVKVLGELADQTLNVLNEVGTSDSAQQRLMRTSLYDQMRGLERQNVPGVTDLVLVGYDGDPDETFAAELEGTHVPVQEYLASAALEEQNVEESSGGSDCDSQEASPLPPLPTAWPLSRGDGAEEEGPPLHPLQLWHRRAVERMWRMEGQGLHLLRQFRRHGLRCWGRLRAAQVGESTVGLTHQDLFPTRGPGTMSNTM